MKESKRIKGVLAPVVTPFKADYSPDHNRFVAQCQWMLTQGSGLAVFGTNSEANSLSVNERMALLDSLLSSGVDPTRMMPENCWHYPLPDGHRSARRGHSP